ncbi:ACT domain protein [Teladorsagia circumcincta]|uniref:Serine racemase n=1 Tax=Teladorsagia circumcincta TaxID=45464 RepID=A0A2G9U6B7_TELCI|nr:ACT domain protein [Teladorsagia circumcincta]
MVNQKTATRLRQERKRTTSDMNDGIEYNKKVRRISKEFMDQANSARANEGANNGDGPEQPSNDILPSDPDCDPDHPKKITFSDISSAAFNIKNGILRTPCSKSSNLSRMLNMELYFKKEYLQATGSFKERGARYALSRLTKEEREIGVIAASAGNHALALSYHGQQLNIPVTVVMPVFAPLMKIGMCRSYGATVVLKGDNIGKAKEHAMRLVMEKKYKYINGYDAPDILAGQGTLGLEILEQSSFDTHWWKYRHNSAGTYNRSRPGVDGRLNRLEVVVSDRPGGIAELATRIAHVGASIKDIFHERAWISTDVFSVKVKVVAETRDRQHVAELEEMLRSKYDDVKVS